MNDLIKSLILGSRNRSLGQDVQIFFGSESKKVPRDETSLKQFNVPATVASSGKFFVPVHDAGKLLLRGNANETCHPCAAAGHRVPWSVLMIHGIQLFQ